MSKKQLEQVNKQIADLEARRTELQVERTATQAAIKEKEEGLGADLLAQGAKSQTSTIDFINRERVKVEGLADAIHQADRQLEELKAERNEIEREIAIAAYEKQVAEGRKIITSCLDHLSEVVANLADLDLTPPIAGYATDETGAVRNMLGHLKDIDLHRKMIELKRIAPEWFGLPPNVPQAQPEPEPRPKVEKMFTKNPYDDTNLNKRKPRPRSVASLHGLPDSAEANDER